MAHEHYPTTVYARIDVPTGRILQIQGRLFGLGDDAGGKFEQKDPLDFTIGGCGFSQVTGTSPNGRIALLTVHHDRLPAAGAFLVWTQLDLSVVVGLEKQQGFPIDLILRPGTKVRIGENDFEVTQVGPDHEDHDQYKFTLETRCHASLIDQLAFTDLAGNPLHVKEPDTSTDGDKGTFALDWQYTLPKKLSAIRVVPTLWTKSRTDDMVLDSMVGPGLGFPRVNFSRKRQISSFPATPTTKPATRPAATQPSLSPVVVRGIRCLGPLSSDTWGWGWGWGQSQGLMVALQVSLSDGHLLGYCCEGSRVDAFCDDKGTNLLDGDTETRSPTDAFGEHGTYQQDGKSCLFHVESKRLPDEHASSLSIRGSLVLRIAHHAVKIRREVPLQNGASFELGGVHYKIKNVGVKVDEVPGYAFTYETNESNRLIENIAFEDLEGKPLDPQRGRWIPGREWQLFLPGPTRAIQFVADSWDDPKLVTVPLDLTVGVGAQENGWEAPKPPQLPAPRHPRHSP